jgi:hypothetical protein
MKNRHVAIAFALFVASIGIAAAALSDSGEVRERAHLDPVYAKECGACHLAYPPSLLPRESWRQVMAGLDHHFGQNAELDEATRARLERALVARAPDVRSGRGEKSLRITGQGWFVDAHHEVPRDVTARASVRSMANCAACHPGAAHWDFDEDRVRIPGG